MDRLFFYEVDKAYVSYLQEHERKIPNITYASHDRFICGVLFSINDMNYFAPVSSFNKEQRSNYLIKNNRGKAISSIRFSFMFPVPDDLVQRKDFSKEPPKYRRLLAEELDFCNRHRDKIIAKARYIYNEVTKNKNPLMIKNCCDFKRLESLYASYCEERYRD